MSPSADNTAIGLINSLFCRKKRTINKFFPIAGSRLSFSVKISRGELTRRINKLLSSVLFSCFVKANLNWIIHLLFRSTCRSLENLSLKLVWSYNFRTVFKMFQLLGHFLCVSRVVCWPTCNPLQTDKVFCFIGNSCSQVAAPQIKLAPCFNKVHCIVLTV